jgi:hypothetical protein
MKISTMFLINTVVAWLFGLALLLIPVAFTGIYGIELDEVGVYLARLLGAALLGFGVLTWRFRFADATKERHDVVLALLFGDAIGTVVALIGQLQGVAGGLGWTTVLVYLLLTLAWVYYARVES